MSNIIPSIHGFVSTTSLWEFCRCEGKEKFPKVPIGQLPPFKWYTYLEVDPTMEIKDLDGNVLHTETLTAIEVGTSEDERTVYEFCFNGTIPDFEGDFYIDVMVSTCHYISQPFTFAEECCLMAIEYWSDKNDTVRFYEEDENIFKYKFWLEKECATKSFPSTLEDATDSLGISTIKTFSLNEATTIIIRLAYPYIVCLLKTLQAYDNINYTDKQGVIKSLSSARITSPETPVLADNCQYNLDMEFISKPLFVKDGCCDKYLSGCEFELNKIDTCCEPFDPCLNDWGFTVKCQIVDGDILFSIDTVTGVVPFDDQGYCYDNGDGTGEQPFNNLTVPAFFNGTNYEDITFVRKIKRAGCPDVRIELTVDMSYPLGIREFLCNDGILTPITNSPLPSDQCIEILINNIWELLGTQTSIGNGYLIRVYNKTNCTSLVYEVSIKDGCEVIFSPA